LNVIVTVGPVFSVLIVVVDAKGTDAPAWKINVGSNDVLEQSQLERILALAITSGMLTPGLLITILLPTLLQRTS
jgi:hypothetical protein